MNPNKRLRRANAAAEAAALRAEAQRTRRSCSLFDEEATTTCGSCGDVYKIIDSDAEEQIAYCSRECQDRDAHAMRSRGLNPTTGEPL